MPTLHIHLSGGFQLLLDTTPVTTVNSSKLQSLLAYLLLHRDVPQDRSRLAFLLWPDATEARAHAGLRKLVYQLRQALPHADQLLFIDNHTLQWLAGSADVSWTLDLVEVEEALARAKQAEQEQDMAAMCHALEEVVQVYRGDLLPSCYDEWILPERDHWHQVFFSTAERLLTHLEQERAYDAAISVAQHLIRHDPLYEAIYRQLMRLYALQGDRASALRVYHTCVTTMERELGAEPGEATRAAYDLLMQFDGSSEMVHSLQSTNKSSASLLGRGTQWRQIQEAWRKASSGSPHLVLLSGEAGIGKTCLAEQMEAWVARQGMVTASARCYAALGALSYAPVTTWLRTDALRAGLSTLDPTWLSEVSRLLPELLAAQPKLSRPAPMREKWQRLQFFEALARAIVAARQPLLLFLDDLQWCDNETLEWLHYLLQFDRKARLLLLGTVRVGETLPGHPLHTFLSALQRDGLVTELCIGALTMAETSSLAEHLLGRALEPAMRKVLYSETEGNPLFVVEMVRAGTIDQQKARQATLDRPLSLLTQSSSTLPPTVQSVLQTRLAQLSQQAQEVANVAAVIGREFTFSVLESACSADEDMVVAGLDELWQRRIVREQGSGIADSYDFSHDKLREQAYTSLSSAHRRLLHRRVAQAFSATYAHDLDSVSGQIATHYERAGLSNQAIPYYQRAGEFALRMYATEEARSAFTQATNLLAQVPGQCKLDIAWETAAQAYTSLGDVSMIVGHYAEAREAYQRAMQYLPASACLWLAHLYREVASSWNHASANPHDISNSNALLSFQEAERILMQSADSLNAEWRREWIELHFSQIWPLRGSADDMTETIEKVRPVIEQYGTQEQRKTFSFAITMRDYMRRRYVVSEQMVEARRKELVAMQQTGDKNQIGIGYLALGIILLWADHLDEAEEQLGKALELAEKVGVAWLQIRSLTFLPFIFRKRGQVEEVRRLLVHAQDVGATRNNSILTGHRAWVAWRDGNLGEAEVYARKSIEERQPQQMEVDPFQWAGLWPLVGVALAQEDMVTAMDTIRMLLSPTQQPPPEQLQSLLEAALQAWEIGKLEEAQGLLQQVVPIAKEKGYL
jgi:DNA-binding SARP family transcriptional activator